jgi:tetratricopeptide (TPR) repeat protein
MKRHLRVFISSTIRECAAERAAAKAAVTSLRHHPILFEDLGASPHPPRPLYVRELSGADVFVGIYRDLYGWIASNATISGLEDEHQLRTKLGLPPLIYVLRPAPERDSRLARIIEEAEQGSTLFYYSDPSELQERITSDLATLVAQGFDPSRFAHGVVQTEISTGPTTEESASGLPYLDPLAVDLLSALVAVGKPLTVEELALASNEKFAVVLHRLGELEGSLLTVSGNIVALLIAAPDLSKKYQIVANPTQREFYSHRMATVFEKGGRILDAYLLFQSTNHPRAATLLARAAHEATRGGQVELALPLLRRSTERAKQEGERDVAVSFLLSTAILSLSAGNALASLAALDEARTLDGGDWDLRIREVELHVRTESTGDEIAMLEIANLRQSFEAERDTYGVARIAAMQSKLFVDLRRFDDAAKCARVALELFTEQENEDGRHVALQNLIAALSAQGGNGEEVRRLSASVDHTRADTARMRAFQCNLAASRLRESGEPGAAAEKSREAIALGEHLGDVSLQLTNRINLGNALSDLGQTDEAIAEYKTVSASASKAGLRIVEGAATRLIATTLNEAKRWVEAVTFAQHAAGLLRGTVDTNNFINSKCEEAEARVGIGEIEFALAAYQEAATTAHRSGQTSKLAGIFIEVANVKKAAPTAILDLVLTVCGANPASTPVDAVFSLASQVGPLLGKVPASQRGRLVRALFSRALGNCPRAALGSVTEALAEELLTKLTSSEPPNLQIFANFLLSFDPSLLSLRQWNLIAQKTTGKFPQLVYKPFTDGAGHWTITIDQRLVATVSELDDTSESFATTFCLAAGLSGIGASYIDALGATTLPRREADVQITTRSEFIALIGKEHAPESGSFVSVTRATNEADPTPPSMQVIVDDGLRLGPHDTLNGVSMATYLLSKTLYEMARHLLKGQVSESALVRRLRPVLFSFYS